MLMEALLMSNVQCVSTFRNVVQDFVELHIFAGAQNVVQHLRNHDCSAALKWCEDNRARVKRHRNRLEFKLRLQASLHTNAVLLFELLSLLYGHLQHSLLCAPSSRYNIDALPPCRSLWS